MEHYFYQPKGHRSSSVCFFLTLLVLGLVISQILIVTVIAFITAWKEDKKPTRIEGTQEIGDCKQRERKKDEGGEKKKGRLFDFFMSCFTGIGMVFNMFIAGSFENIPFYVYLLY